MRPVLRYPSAGLFALVLLLTACDGGADRAAPAPSSSPSSPAPETPTTPSPSPSMVVECPEQHAAAAPTSGAIAGRIDMDLEDDSAYLYSDETAEAGCSLLLVVETAIGQVHSVPISGEGIDPGRAAIRYLGRVDERPGAEIVVRMLTGASTEFVALFSLGDGRLERMTVETEDPYGDLFPSGGSVGHLEATDCASNAGDDGYIVMSLATPQGDGYRLRRTFYTSSDGAFDVDEIVEQKLSDPQDLEAYQEFSGTPFGTCAAGT